MRAEKREWPDSRGLQVGPTFTRWHSTEVTDDCQEAVTFQFGTEILKDRPQISRYREFADFRTSHCRKAYAETSGENIICVSVKHPTSVRTGDKITQCANETTLTRECKSTKAIAQTQSEKMNRRVHGSIWIYCFSAIIEYWDFEPSDFVLEYCYLDALTEYLVFDSVQLLISFEMIWPG